MKNTQKEKDWSNPVFCSEINDQLSPVTLWRYMSLAKFIHLISTSSIYLPQSSQFEDPMEGHLPESIFLEFQKRLEKSQHITETNKKYELATLKNYSNFTLVSCWHASQHESEAMWKLYSKDNQSIAIQTTVHKLVPSLGRLPEHARAGFVKYIDFKNPPKYFKIDPIYTKRNSYSHEKEFRIAFTQQSLFPKSEGDTFNCDINKLITSIHISPWSDRLFTHAVEEVSKKFLESPVIHKSELLQPPNWY